MKQETCRFFRLTAWLLSFILLCAAFPGCAAAETAEENDVFALVSSMLTVLDQDPPADRALEDQESVDAYCLKLYNMIDPSQVQSVCYGGPEDAAALLTQLSAILYPGVGYTDSTLANAELLYTAVWSVIHADLPSEYKSRPTVKEIMKSMIEGFDDAVISDAVDACIDYIDLNEPELVQSGYNINKLTATIEGSDEFIQYYEEGYRLFEEGKYAEAIEAYTAALAYKENDAETSLEIAQAYIAMRDYAQAKAWLVRIAPYVESSNAKGRWLRSLGFIGIEELNYETAYALYAYSLSVEESPTAEQELQYIKYIYPSVKEFTAEEAYEYLKDLGIIPGE